MGNDDKDRPTVTGLAGQPSVALPVDVPLIGDWLRDGFVTVL